MFTGRSLAAALALALVSLPLGGATKETPNSLDAVIKKVQQQQKDTRTLEADFRQEKESAFLAKAEVSTGRFVFSKPRSVLWTYEEPKRVQMVIDQGTLTTWFPDLNKVERVDVSRFEDRIFRYMGASGAIDELARYFDFTFRDRADNPFFVLDLQPKSKMVARRVKHIRIWIDRETFLTTKFEYTEADGDVTRYEFTNVKVNRPIEQSRFTLNLPKNVKVEQVRVQ
jgi:outer membrane lipoprotein-sorting protein